MADDDTTPEPGADEAAPAAGDATSTGTADLAAAGKKALDAERRARRDAETQIRKLQAQLKELTDRDKSETERLRDELADAQKRAEQAEQQLLRIEIGHARGLSPAQARRLVGTTREELEADAADLLAAFGGGRQAAAGAGGQDAAAGADGAASDADGGQGGAKPAGQRRPAEKLTPGASPVGAAERVDAAAIASKILERPF